MRESLGQIQPTRLATRLDSWVLRLLTEPPESRLVRGLIIAGYIIVLGLIDYASGPSLSLQVFYLAPILLALAWLGFFASFVASVCAILSQVGGDYLLGAAYTHRPTILWNSLGHLATYLLVALFLKSLLKLRRELEARVLSSTAALAKEIVAHEQLQREMLELSERERRSIGHELHDGLGQHLTAMAFAAQVLNQQLTLGDKVAVDTAREIVRLAEDGIQQSRQLARSLLLTAIDPGNLNRELEELAASVQQQTGVRCHFESRTPVLVGNSSTASHLFCIAQEAMHLAIRYDRPSALQLSLNGESRELLLTVSGNAATPPPSAEPEAEVALRQIEHRARLIGADFIYQSNPGQGTRLCCRLPTPALQAALA